jgi:SH3-like domain-containing protein
MKTKAFSNHFRVTLVALLILSFPAAAVAADYVSVKKDGVNIRSGPGTDHNVVWQVFESFPLKILKRDGKWVSVEDYQGDKGWIYSPLVSSKKTVIVNVEMGNMRSGPSTNDDVIAEVKKGVVFEAREMSGDWIKVRYKDGLTGWMHNSLLWPGNPF